MDFPTDSEPTEISLGEVGERMNALCEEAGLRRPDWVRRNPYNHDEVEVGWEQERVVVIVEPGSESLGGS